MRAPGCRGREGRKPRPKERMEELHEALPLEMVALISGEPVAEEDFIFHRIAPRGRTPCSPSAPGRADKTLHSGHGSLYFPDRSIDRDNLRPPHGEDEG